MNETRAHVRYDIRVSADLSLESGEVITSLTRDLSLGGVGVDTEQPLSEGVELDMTLFVVVDDIEDEATLPLHLRGKVVWSRMKSAREFLAGVQFLDVTEEQRTYLSQLVSALAS